MTTWLLDTGPLIAALNRRDPQHRRCATALAAHAGDLLTTGAVVTEAMHFLGGVPNGAETLAGFLADAPVGIRDCFGTAELQTAARLMQKYSDIPMDFADATLVLLAEETGCSQVLTLDERGFRAYRHHGKSRFTLVLD